MVSFRCKTNRGIIGKRMGRYEDRLIGFGNMAQAIAKGWIRSGQVTGAQMIASARDQDKLHRVTEGLGMQAAANNAAVCRAADLLVVAVKPAMISDVLLPLQEN